MNGGVIVGLTATEVVVRAHPDAITSSGLDRPLHKIPSGGARAWSIQFDELPKLVLELRLADGTVGLGECYRDHDWRIVADMAERLIGQDVAGLTLQALPLVRVREYDGFEVAIWDAVARRHGLRVVDLLGGPVRDRIEVSAWSGQRYTDDLASVAAAYARQGHATLKLKCDARDDIVGWCEAIAEAAPGLRLLLDPNERLDHLAFARGLAADLERVGNVLLLEDPLPQWQRQDWALLRASTTIPVVRHVALGYPSLGNRRSDVVTAIRDETVDGFNLSAGIADYARLDHVAALAGLRTFHGSEVDLGILEAAYLHSACAAESCTWPSDVFGRSIRSHDLLATPLALDPPHIALPTGPGLGIDLDRDAVDAATRTVRTFGA